MKTIAHITDIHLNESFPTSLGINTWQNWDKALAFLTERGIEQIIFGGDIGDASAHDQFFDSLKDFETTIVLGNHDQQAFKNFTKAAQHEHYYHFEDANYRYIVLDSSTDALSTEQLKWLGEALKTEKKIVLFVHHPILAVPCYVETHYALKGREKVRQLLVDTGLEVTIFCGHYHLQDERDEQNIRQLVSPALSYQMIKSTEKAIDSSTFGIRLIDISPDAITTEVVSFPCK